MAKSLGMAKRWRRILRWPRTILPRMGGVRTVLVLRLTEGEALRRRLGPALFERLIGNLTARLTRDLGLRPQAREAGGCEISGILSGEPGISLPEKIYLLGQIGGRPVDLGGVRVLAQTDGIIVRAAAETDCARMIAFGRGAFAEIPATARHGSVRVLDYTMSDMADIAAGPAQRPDPLALRFRPQICCDSGRLVALGIEQEISALGSTCWAPVGAVAGCDGDQETEFFAAVLRHALVSLKGWDRQGHDVPFLSLPVPGKVLSDRLFAETVIWELERQNLSADRLEIEFTESDGNGPEAIAMHGNLTRLVAAGCRIATGDFGAGRARLNDLTALGVKRARVGRSFIADCGQHGDRQRMILAIIALAENLGLDLLADGVMNTDEYGFLAQIGFHAVQGDVVAPAVDTAQVAEYLTDHAADLPDGLRLGRMG